MSEQSSIVYNVRLPKDPPRTFDIHRVTVPILYYATQMSNMDSALNPICKLVGLENFDSMHSNECSKADWQTAVPRSRCYWTVCWLMREDKIRSGQKSTGGSK